MPFGALACPSADSARCYSRKASCITFSQVLLSGRVRDQYRNLGRSRLLMHTDDLQESVVIDPKLRGAVLFVGNFVSAWQGSRNVCEDLAERLGSLDWRTLRTSSRRSRLARFNDMVVTVWRQRRVYAVASVDVFSGTAFIWAEVVCFMLDRLRVPYLMNLHGGNLPAFAARWPRRVRRLLSHPTVVTTPSRYLLERMLPYRSNIELVPNAIDISLYRFRPRLRPSPRLVWMRAFHHTYNPTLAPRVVARLIQEFPDIQLEMIGPDKDDGSLADTKRVVEQFSLSEHITFVGGIAKSDVPIWLDRGDVFINTTNVDNTPVSVIEAMACGLCVVSTDVGGLPYLLSHGENAVLVRPNDEDAMASAVGRILREPAYSVRLSRNARTAAEHFDWSCILKKWDRLLLGLLK
jgi:glycosyltransferase involved in cell wall biosynthesis